MAEPPASHLGPQQSWWATLPGVLTAIAGLLTAVTGLIVALSALGFPPLSEPSRAAGGAATEPARQGATTDPGASADPTRSPPWTRAAYVVDFPSGQDAQVVHARSGDVVYTVLDSSVRQPNAQQLQLTLSVRLTNNGDLDVGFGTDAFRLLVDGVPRAPDNDLNDLVDARSAGEGTVVFSVPAGAGRLLLRIGDDYVDDPADLPLELRTS